MAPAHNEAFSCVLIDKALEASGWDLLDSRRVQFEYHSANGRADYLLKDSLGRVLCVLEAKREDIDPYDAKAQARGYAENLRAPFILLSNGRENWLWNYERGDQRDAFRIERLPSSNDLERLRYKNLQSPRPLSSEVITSAPRNPTLSCADTCRSGTSWCSDERPTRSTATRHRSNFDNNTLMSYSAVDTKNCACFAMEKLSFSSNQVKNLCCVIALAVVAGCATPPYRLVYSSGFTFAQYDYLVVAKPDSNGTSASLYGFDIEFANLMSRYNMKVIGDKEFESLTPAEKRQTLFARMSMVATSKKVNLISISFDDAVSGKTVASVTAKAKGNMFDASDRTKAFEAVSDALIQALERDKGLSVTDMNASKSR